MAAALPTGVKSDTAPVPQSKIFVHVGYPKCASTFLQRQVFSRASGLNAHCPDDFTPMLLCDRAATDYSEAERAAQFLQIPRSLEEHYKNDRAAIDFTEEERAARLSDIRDAAANDPRPTLFSSEEMCIGPWQDNPRYYTTDSTENITARIQQYFPEATIILCLRPQVEWIESWWRQKVNGFLTDKPAKMLETPFWRDELLPRLRYNETVKTYRKAFGTDRVMVLFFADLRRDPAAFVTKLCTTIGINVPDWSLESRNEGRSTGYLYTKLYANRAYLAASRTLFSERFCKKEIDNRYHQFWKRYLAHSDRLLAPLSGKKVLRGPLAETVHAMFRDDNAELADLLDTDLAPHGFKI